MQQTQIERHSTFHSKAPGGPSLRDLAPGLGGFTVYLASFLWLENWGTGRPQPLGRSGQGWLEGLTLTSCGSLSECVCVEGRGRLSATEKQTGWDVEVCVDRHE